jgi:hypothetical protein
MLLFSSLLTRASPRVSAALSSSLPEPNRAHCRARGRQVQARVGGARMFGGDSLACGCRKTITGGGEDGGPATWFSFGEAGVRLAINPSIALNARGIAQSAGLDQQEFRRSRGTRMAGHGSNRLARSAQQSQDVDRKNSVGCRPHRRARRPPAGAGGTRRTGGASSLGALLLVPAVLLVPLPRCARREPFAARIAFRVPLFLPSSL